MFGYTTPLGLRNFLAYLPDRTRSETHETNKPPLKTTDGFTLPDYDEDEASFMLGLNFPATAYDGDIGGIRDKKDFMKQQIKDWNPG
jgi:hypothetical protein